ncbi:MAG: ferredoxin family protein [Candidatus Bathyarchaeia archaeon]|nr:ferredoxin family protein [Candidatus Bathyarchaeota archaeon]
MTKACTPWYPTIFPEKCDGCTTYGKPRCVEYCPNSVFAFMNGKALVANPHKCVNGCTACEPICHKKAITFPKPQHIFTSPAKKDLLHKITCKKCGKTFWTNRESTLCFSCETDTSHAIQPNEPQA